MNPPSDLSHLWEAHHPYYCSASNYYSNDPGSQYDSWEEYLDEWGNNDPDLNLLFRWDWKRPRDDEFFEAGEDESETLWLFFVLQRKGIFLVNQVTVTPDDESSVREYLTKAWLHMQTLWLPFEAQS